MGQRVIGESQNEKANKKTCSHCIPDGAYANKT